MELEQFVTQKQEMLSALVQREELEIHFLDVVSLPVFKFIFAEKKFQIQLTFLRMIAF